MITTITAPDNMVAFRATGEVTKEDFVNIVIPQSKAAMEQNGELNYLLVLDTDLKNFTMGAWIQDAALGLKALTKWNRAAIVSDKESIRTFTDVFSKFVPGEFRGYEHDELEEAIAWVSGKR